MVLGRYEIPFGTKVLIWNQISFNSEENFDNPEMFLPERWLRGHPQCHSSHPFSNLPFGHGPRFLVSFPFFITKYFFRFCIGQRFAKLELYMILAKMIQRFKLEYHGVEVDVKTGFTNSPDRNVILKITER